MVRGGGRTGGRVVRDGGREAEDGQRRWTGWRTGGQRRWTGWRTGGRKWVLSFAWRVEQTVVTENVIDVLLLTALACKKKYSYMLQMRAFLKVRLEPGPLPHKIRWVKYQARSASFITARSPASCAYSYSYEVTYFL